MISFYPILPNKRLRNSKWYAKSCTLELRNVKQIRVDTFTFFYLRPLSGYGEAPAPYQFIHWFPHLFHHIQIDLWEDDEPKHFEISNSAIWIFSYSVTTSVRPYYRIGQLPCLCPDTQSITSDKMIFHTWNKLVQRKTWTREDLFNNEP